MNVIGVVIVGGIGYQVALVPNHEMVADEPGHTLMGDVSYLTNVIRINELLEDERKDQTIAHELVHAMLYECGIEEHNEEFVCRFDKVLHKFLKDNTDFYKRINKPPERK